MLRRGWWISGVREARCRNPSFHPRSFMFNLVGASDDYSQLAPILVRANTLRASGSRDSSSRFGYEMEYPSPADPNARRVT